MASLRPQDAGPRRRVPALDPAARWTVAATLAALVLWTRQLAAPLFLDEGASWFLAYQPTWGGFWDLLRQQEVAPPPFYVGLRLVVHDLGQDGHSAMRLPVVLATLPCVPLAAVLARQVRPDPRAAAWAAWLVALSPLLLEYAQQVRAYGPAMTATLLAAVLVARADRRGWRSRDAWPAALALGAGVWVHYVAAAPLVVLAAVALWRAPGRSRWLVAGVVGVVWLGAAAFARGQYGSVGAGVDEFVDLRWDDLRHVLAGAWEGRFRGATWLLLPGVAALAGAVVAVVRARGLHRAVLLAGLAGPAAVVVLSAVGPDITLSRYAAPAAPLLVVGLAAAWASSRSGRIALAVLAACAAAGSLRSLHPDHGRYPDHEATVLSVLPTFGPAGGVLASSDLGTGLWLATYVTENSGTQGVTTALGGDALVAAVCAGRPIRQLVPANAAIPVQREWYRALGYATRTAPSASATTTVVVADPGPRTTCPRPGPAPPVT